MTNSGDGLNRRNFLKLTGVLATAAGIAACANMDKRTSSLSGGAQGADGRPTDEITAAISYELGTNGYDPMTTTAALTIAANWHTMEGLYEITPTPDRKVYAALAATEDPQQIDDITYEVPLRDGAVFHNGAVVTATDVVYSFERVLDPLNNSQYSAFISFIDTVEKKDDTTVTIRLKYPFNMLKERLATIKIVPKAVVERSQKEFDANPIGTGPWKMVDNGAASSALVFEKNPKYTGPKPAKANRMSWRILPNASTRTHAIESKAVDAIDSVPYLSIDQVQNNADVESVQGFGLLFVMFNHADGSKMRDIKNRQGVMYSFDIDKVIRTGMLGQATAATCFVQEQHDFYHKAATVYTLDRAKATQLFAETGLKKVTMLAASHDWVKPCAEILNESLTAAGIEVDFKSLKSAKLYDQIEATGDWDIVVAPGDPSVFGNDVDLLLRWWYAADLWTNTRMHWKNTDSYNKVQELLDRAARASGDEQESIWHEIFDLIAYELPLYPLFHRKNPSAWDSTVLTGFEPIALTGLSFIDVGLKAPKQ